jgi:hypothetical protein
MRYLNNRLRKFFVLWITTLVGFLLFATSATSATIYVDINNTSGVEDGTVDNPYNSIHVRGDLKLC